MSRLAKTGISLLGIATLGTFVASLGGPNVFSTFSNIISAIRPKTEIAVEGKKEEKTENKVNTESKQEEQKNLITEEIKQEAEVITATQPVTEIIQETQTEQQIKPQANTTPTNIPTPSTQAQRGPESPSGKEQHPAPSNSAGAGGKGSGIWCGASWGSFMMKKGEKCGNLTFEEVEDLFRKK